MLGIKLKLALVLYWEFNFIPPRLWEFEYDCFLCKINLNFEWGSSRYNIL